MSRMAGSSSTSRLTAWRAFSARWRSGWASSTMGCSMCVISSPIPTRNGWSCTTEATRFFPGMSAAVTMVNSAQGMPAPKWMPFRMPRGTWERTVTPWRASGTNLSSV